MKLRIGAAFLLGINYLTTCIPVRAEVVETILAVVGETPILSSDLALAELVQLVPATPGDSAPEHDRKLLDARVQLELQFRDLEASGALHRLAVDPTPVADRLLAAGGGRATLAAALTDHGLTWTDVDDLALRLAATTAWVEQRLRPRITVRREEVEALLVAELGHDAVAALGGAGATVRAQAQQLLVERQLNDEIARWIEEARRRQGVTRFAP